MSLSMTPIIGGPPGDIDVFIATLKFLSDPQAMKKLADLLKAIQDANQEQHEILAAASKEKDEATALMNKVSITRADLEKRERALQGERQHFIELEQNLQNREDELSKQSQALQAHLNNAAKLDIEVQARNEQSIAREERVHQGEEALKHSVDEHRRWLESIKPPR